MSKQSSRGSVKKEFSVTNWLERSKKWNSNCSLDKAKDKLPCIVKKAEKLREKSGSEGELPEKKSLSKKPWYDYDLILPKMRPVRKKNSSTSSTKHSSPSTTPWTDHYLEGLSDHTMEYQGEDNPKFNGSCFLTQGQKRDLSGDYFVSVMGPSGCQASFAVSKNDSSYESIHAVGEPVAESHALENWKKWMKIRKEQDEIFQKKLKRDVSQLVHNRGKHLRQIKEEKEMLEYAQIPPTDKWRGSPLFWNVPVSLPPMYGRDDYYVHRTHYDKGIIPPFEFVTIPDKIKEEMGLASDESAKPKNRHAFENLEYRKSRRKEWKKNLAIMKPHEIQGEDLIVTGTQITPVAEEILQTIRNMPTIVVTKPEESEKPPFPIPPDCAKLSTQTISENRLSVASLVIDGVGIGYFPDGPQLENSDMSIGTYDSTPVWDSFHFSDSEGEEQLEFSLVFEAAPPGTTTEKKVRIENRGTVSIQYRWETEIRPVKPENFPLMKVTHSGPNFFFNKNSGIFLPGQIVELSFYHNSRRAGFHMEICCLVLNPAITPTGRVKFRLTGVTDIVHGIENLVIIENYVESCVKESAVRLLLEEILERVRFRNRRMLEYPSLFMEEELFEFQNPAYYYRHDVVQELKTIFKEIPLDCNLEWDLSLLTLESLIRAHTTGREQHSMMCRVMGLTKTLLRPGREYYKVDRKYKMLYNLLCNVMDTIDRNGRTLKQCFKSGLDEVAEWRGDTLESQEEEPVPVISIKSAESHVSSESLPVLGKESSFGEQTASESLAEIDIKDWAYYRHALYTMVFKTLCDAAEQAAGIIQTCKLFEHHGEVISEEVLAKLMEE